MLNVGKGRLLMLIRLLLRCRAVALLDGSAALQAQELPSSVSTRGATENRTHNAWKKGGKFIHLKNFLRGYARCLCLGQFLSRRRMSFEYEETHIMVQSSPAKGAAGIDTCRVGAGSASANTQEG